MTDYGNTIKELRKVCNMSQEELARELGVSFASVNRWDTGKHIPSKMAWKAIEAFCQVRQLTEFLTGGGTDET